MLHSLYKKQLLRSSIDSVWAFMSNPANLAKITPPYMRFRVLSGGGGDKVFPGQILEYKVSPLLGIPLGWVTEITHVQDKAYFVDEQRYGPYAFWHHKHFLTETAEGVEMTDWVHDKLPLGFAGRLVNALLVRKQLEAIFAYRFSQLESLFNKGTAEQAGLFA